MSTRAFTAFVVVLIGLALQSAEGNLAVAQKKKPKNKPKEPQDTTLSLVSLEVSALQGLHRFQLTKEQMEAVKKMASDTVPKGDTRMPGKGSDKLRKRLFDLRDALIEGDDQRIAELEEKVADLLEEEDKETELDDLVKVTPAAVKRAKELLRTLRSSQVASFLADSSDELPDPLETLTNTLEVVAGLSDAEWKDLANDIVEATRWQLGGLDPNANKAAAANVEAYLKKIRGLKDKDIEAQRAQLEKAAEAIVAQTPPMVILQNIVEHALAEMLSNPRLPAALEARLDTDADGK